MAKPQTYHSERLKMTTDKRRLKIEFHGRVIEHLGIDMYQSPVAAIAELISNAWDADSSKVEVELPDRLREDAKLTISDNGEGMTFTQCQDRYLAVGYNRRKDRRSEQTRLGRPVMGRKGIGKFAGFGIAELVTVETVSSETGEKTVFQLDVEQLTGGDKYAGRKPMDVDVIEYLEPDESRKALHGTKITLQSLTMKQKSNIDAFRRSMARRFLLLERSDEFDVLVNGEPISQHDDVENIEFDFPSDYSDKRRPENIEIEDGWGIERLSNGHKIRWRFVFYRDTINDEELVGISIFSRRKLAQRPFNFNLASSVGGQQGLSYLSGRVEADFIDDQPKDLISTERQRINWDSDTSTPLLHWGQEKVKSLLRIWQEARTEAKVRAMNDKIAPFTPRLDKLERRERSIVERALKSMARISVLSDQNFTDIANAILGAWEKGRLNDLIGDLADAGELDAEALVKILAESEVMSALHAAERVRAQLNLIQGLEKRIENKELELAVRDYIAENPWLISPEWDTFKVERSVSGLMKELGAELLDGNTDWKARIDLALRAGSQLLVVEFMRPGVTADWDHIYRFERYVYSLRDVVTARRRGDFRDVSGLMVADRLENPKGFAGKLASMRREGFDVVDWAGLLERARRQWQDYFEILHGRAPNDDRMQDLACGQVGRN
ncbi:ATP-binding protein [Amycolatopsis sp. NPDC049159]|uniref:ATP-binding protein n=1 Tax=Amycolatopsis sp. NPDC049159 TaxID=3157210 RepID=UPI003410078D